MIAVCIFCVISTKSKKVESGKGFIKGKLQQAKGTGKKMMPAKKAAGVGAAKTKGAKAAKKKIKPGIKSAS